jgi:hypothetical protein
MGHQIQIQKMAGVTIRRLGSADLPEVVRLAGRDSKDMPEGALLGAEVEGRLLAVAPIAGGETIADPFSRTSELRALLELRIEQLRGRKRERTRLGGLLARRGRRGVTTAPTPAGAGRQLLPQELRPY